jgi:hypothetical protein
MNHDTKTPPATDWRSMLVSLSPDELALLGLEEMAYIRKVVDGDGVAGYAIHRAEGSHIGVVAEHALAAAVIKQNGLEPVSVH